MSAVTDTSADIRTDRNRPGITNLLTLFSLVTGRTVEKLELDYLGKGYGDFKRDLADAVVAYILPIQERIYAHLKDEAALLDVLNDGATRAGELAEKKIAVVRKRLGVNL
jgi:tryptophanyl-tRNA synthetase